MSTTASSTSTDTEPNAASSTSSTAENVIYETGPSVKPATAKLGMALAVSLLAVGYIFTHPTLLGTEGNTQIAGYVVAMIAVLLLIRYSVRVYLLKRYKYTITDDAVRWEYSLFYKHRSRELPFAKIRGHEFQQDRIQSLFGFGTVSFLSGGTNQSLGFVRFQNVAELDDIQSLVRNQLTDTES